MMYIWAWQAAALPPERLTSSRITLASRTVSPEPPYCSGMSAASQPASVSSCTKCSGYSSSLSSLRQYSSGYLRHSLRISSRISGHCSMDGMRLSLSGGSNGLGADGWAAPSARSVSAQDQVWTDHRSTKGGGIDRGLRDQNSLGGSCQSGCRPARLRRRPGASFFTTRLSSPRGTSSSAMVAAAGDDDLLGQRRADMGGQQGG